jgi:hypothetical protein
VSFQFPPPAVLRQNRSDIITFLRLMIRAWEVSQASDVTFTSWYRTQEETQTLREASNSGIQGYSQHGLGLALDYVGPDAARLAAMANSLGLVSVHETNSIKGYGVDPPRNDHWHTQRFHRHPAAYPPPGGDPTFAHG